MDRLGFWVFLAGIVSAWIAIHFNSKMQMDVNRLAPPKSIGLRNLFESNDNGRIWREHKRLFPKSRVRDWAKAFFIAAVTLAVLGFVLFGVRI